MQTYGYAGAYDPEHLQSQIERLTDAGVPEANIISVLLAGDDDKKDWSSVTNCVHDGDVLYVVSFPVLGADILSVGKRIRQLKDSGIDVRFLEPGSGAWGSQENIESAFEELVNEFSGIKPKKGRPRKPYPPGWRDVYNSYIMRNMSYKEACEILGIPDYDFFRMVQRYKKFKDNEEKEGD